MKICFAAASGGHLECLKYLHEMSLGWKYLFGGGTWSPQCLKYGGCPWDEMTCSVCPNGYLECLKYARKCPGMNGLVRCCEHAPRVFEICAKRVSLRKNLFFGCENGQLECLIRHEKGCPECGICAKIPLSAHTTVKKERKKKENEKMKNENEKSTDNRKRSVCVRERERERESIMQSYSLFCYV